MSRTPAGWLELGQYLKADRPCKSSQRASPTLLPRTSPRSGQVSKIVSTIGSPRVRKASMLPVRRSYDKFLITATDSRPVSPFRITSHFITGFVTTYTTICVSNAVDRGQKSLSCGQLSLDQRIGLITTAEFRLSLWRLSVSKMPLLSLCVTGSK